MESSCFIQPESDGRGTGSKPSVGGSACPAELKKKHSVIVGYRGRGLASLGHEKAEMSFKKVDLNIRKQW